jgi:hypothetical protein
LYSPHSKQGSPNQELPFLLQDENIFFHMTRQLMKVMLDGTAL